MDADHLKNIISIELHSLKQDGSYAPISIGNPARVHRPDYSVFKKDMNERMKLFTLKEQYIKKPLTLIGRYQF